MYKSPNHVIDFLLYEKEITKEEYNILFSDKKNWITEVTHDSMSQYYIETVFFTNTLNKVISLQTRDTIEFDNIIFPTIILGNLLRNVKPNLHISLHNCLFQGDLTLMGNTHLGVINFEGSEFYGEIIGQNTLFSSGIHFYKCKFHNKVDFRHLISLISINFEDSTFKKEVDFSHAKFLGYAGFTNVTFLSNSIFDNLVFTKIDFTNTLLSNTNFLNLFSISVQKINILKHDDKVDNNKLYIIYRDKISQNKDEITANNFNKETARIIKAHFEKQNNISEANKYFQIEQELYIDELHKSKTEPSRISTLITLYLNKLVSNFGTDWIRSLLLLLMLSYLFMRVYIDLDSYLSSDEHIKHFTNVSDIQYVWAMLVSWFLLYLSTFYKSQKFTFWCLLSIGIVMGITAIGMYDNVLAMQNYIIQLTNPINAFKNMNLYEGIELYGAIVRITVVTIIYQFIVAFRQNTRRK